MALYPSGTQFGGSMYNNPQMGAQKTMAANPYMDYFQQIYKNLGTPSQNPWSQMTQTYGGNIGNVQAQNITPAQLGMNPMDVVSSTRPLIDQAMKEQFARAGQRFGAQGMLASTPYMGELGKQAGYASNQLANTYYRTLMGAAGNQAGRNMQAALANQGANLQAGLGNQQANLQAWSLAQQGANPWFGLAGQMAQLGLGGQQLAQQGQQFQQSLAQQKEALAQQMGLNYAQLNQQQKQFVDNLALQQQQLGQQGEQFSQTLAFQKEQAGQQSQQDWFNKLMQWVMAGGDPSKFYQYGGQGTNPNAAKKTNPW